MISGDVKANVKQKIEELGVAGLSHKCLQEVHSKLEA